MPSTKAGKSSNKNTVHSEHGPEKGVQIHFIPAVDTRYPDLRSRRRFKGNGPMPENPYGGEMATSPYPYTEVKHDHFYQDEKVQLGTVKSGKKASGGEY